MADRATIVTALGKRPWLGVILLASTVACSTGSRSERPQLEGGVANPAAAPEGAGGPDSAPAGRGDASVDAGGARREGGTAPGSNADADASTALDAAGDAESPDAAAAPPVGTPHVYVSGYGPDITHFTLDLGTGALANQGAVSGGTSPSYLAIAPNARTLYAVNEASGQGSQVVAFAIDPVSGALSEINRVASGGQGAPHLAVHPSGAYVAVAHYGSGHVSLLPIRADGGVEAAVDTERGPNDDCRKAHQAVFDRSGLHLLVPCLESNYVLAFELANGVLGYADPPTVAVSGGPRHMALDPEEQHAYVLSELGSLITSFSYDNANGTLTDPQTIDSEDATKGASAHIAVHPSGRFLYASNRAENSLGLFAIDAAGRPTAVAFEREGIDTPRDFTIDPTGQYLILANQNGTEDLRVYRIDPSDGRLTHVRTVAVGGRPTFVGVVLL